MLSSFHSQPSLLRRFVRSLASDQGASLQATLKTLTGEVSRESNFGLGFCWMCTIGMLCLEGVQHLSCSVQCCAWCDHHTVAV